MADTPPSTQPSTSTPNLNPQREESASRKNIELSDEDGQRTAEVKDFKPNGASSSPKSGSLGGGVPPPDGAIVMLAHLKRDRQKKDKNKKRVRSERCSCGVWISKDKNKCNMCSRYWYCSCGKSVLNGAIDCEDCRNKRCPT